MTDSGGRKRIDGSRQSTLDGPTRVAMAAPVVARRIEDHIRRLDAEDAPAKAKADPPNAKTPYYVRRIDVGTRYKALSDGGDANSAISGLADKDGRVHLGMEIDSLIRDVAPDLYEYFGAFVREDMNNALRQVRSARARKRDAHVHVILNRDARTVEVHDVDTDGMPVAVFRDVYTVLGRSGNLDGRESGQKGIGRFAYLGASDTKIVETYARETGERYGFIVRGGKVFEPIPDDMLSIAEYGTRTSVCVDKRHNFDELPEYVRKVAAASKAPVYLTTVGFPRNPTRARVSGKGGRGCTCKDAVRINTADFEFVGCMRCGDMPNRDANATYLIGIPIRAHGRPPCGDLFRTTTLNILDERKYEPTTSRDWLTKSASSRIWEAVAAAVESELRGIECDPSQILSDVPAIVRELAARNVVMRHEKVEGEDDATVPVPLLNIMSESVRQAVQRLGTNYNVMAFVDRRDFDSGAIPRAKLPDGKPRFSDSTWDINNAIVPRTLKWIVANNNNDAGQVWYAPDTAIKWRRAAFEYVEDNRGPVIFLYDGQGWEELERLGAKRIAAYEAPPAERKPGRVTVRYGTHTVRKDAKELGRNVVCVPRDPGVTRLEKVCVAMRADDFKLENLGICPWHADAAESDAETFDHMRAMVDAQEYRTTAGLMTGREILDTPRERLAVCPPDSEWVKAVCDDDVVSGAAGRNVVVVYRTDDADGDRLWLAYGYENDGEMPRFLKHIDLKEAALAGVGVPKSIVKKVSVPNEPETIVGQLRMLLTAPQRVMYLRLLSEMNEYRLDEDEARELEQACMYLSETDRTYDDLGLCRHILRGMNSGRHCDAMVDTRYGDHDWRQLLVTIAVNRLARADMGCSLYDRGEGVYDYRQLSSADGAERLYKDVLRSMFGGDAAVRVDLAENDRVVIDAVLGRGADGNGVHLGGTLARMLFGQRPSYSIGCTGDGRLRICGEIGYVVDEKARRYDRGVDGDFSRSSKYDSW